MLPEGGSGSLAENSSDSPNGDREEQKSFETQSKKEEHTQIEQLKEILLVELSTISEETFASLDEVIGFQR